MAEDFSFLANPLAFEDVIPKFKQDTAEARRQRAIDLGYSVNGDIAAKNINGIKNTFSLMGSNQFAPAPGEQTSFLGQLGGVLGHEIPALQGAANRQYQRGAGAISDFSSSLGDLGRLESGTNEQAAGVEQFAGRNEALGNEAVARGRSLSSTLLGNANTDIGRVNSDLDKQQGYLDKTLSYAENSVGSAKNALAGYDSGYTEAIRSTVAGLNRNADNALAQIESGKNAEGLPFSDAEKWQMRRQLMADTGQQVAGTAAQMRDRMQTTKAQLGMALSEAESKAGSLALGAAGEARAGAQTRLGAASLRAEVGAEAGRLEAQAEQARVAYQQIAAHAQEYAAGLRNAGLMQSVMAKIEGLKTKFAMIQDNPESIVSIFSALASLGQLISAPGSDRLPGVNLGSRNG